MLGRQLRRAQREYWGGSSKLPGAGTNKAHTACGGYQAAWGTLIMSTPTPRRDARQGAMMDASRAGRVQFVSVPQLDEEDEEGGGAATGLLAS
jgi:hypothetical protein